MAGFVTIQELAEMMSASGHGDNINALAKKAWRAYGAGTFGPDARKTGEGTATIIIPADEAREWIANGCPTPGMIAPKRDGETLATIASHEKYYDRDTGEWRRYDDVAD